MVGMDVDRNGRFGGEYVARGFGIVGIKMGRKEGS